METVDGTAPVDLSPFDAWDTFPPERGRIVLLSSADADLVVAGDYRVVLSFGPRRGYTMGWAIEAYAAGGIPVVPRGTGTTPATDPDATRQDAERTVRASVALPEGAARVWCGDLLLELSGLRRIAAELRPEAAERLRALRQATTRVVPVDRPPTAAENRELYERMRRMDLPDAVLETMVFVLALDDEELELSRNEIEPAHVRDYARLYPMLPTWPQRAALAYVLQDVGHDGDPADLTDLRFDILRAPAADPLDLRHIAKAAALARLQGDPRRADGYLDDVGRLERDAAVWATLVTPP